MKRVTVLSLCLGLLLAPSLFAGSLEIGSMMPDFSVQSIEGADVGSSAISGDLTLVTFIATRCPISNDYNTRMKEIYTAYQGKGVEFIFINSNVKEVASEVKKHAAENGFAFAVYKDAGNVVADQFGAQVTPESFLFMDGKLAYHGRIDDAQKGEIGEHSLKNALDAATSGKKPEHQVRKAFGCTIKRVKAS